MNVIDQIGELTRKLEEEEASILAEEQEAETLEQQAKDKRAAVAGRKARVEVERKYMALIKQFIEEQNDHAKSEDSAFRSYTRQVNAIVGEDEGITRATKEYRQARRLPDEDDAPPQDQEQPTISAIAS